MSDNKSPIPVWLLAVIALFAVGFYVFGGSGLVTESGDNIQTYPSVSDEGTGSVERDNDSSSAEATRFSDLPAVKSGQLPPEAIDTLDLIFSGGPFPFSRDDMTFQNREALLPDQSRGYYREYTVITPGEDDRGARRIVAGADGDLYYTNDHYQSFSEIVGASQ